MLYLSCHHGSGGAEQPQYMLVAPPTISGRTMFSPSRVNRSACLSAYSSAPGYVPYSGLPRQSRPRSSSSTRFPASASSAVATSPASPAPSDDVNLSSASVVQNAAGN